MSLCLSATISGVTRNYVYGEQTQRRRVGWSLGRVSPPQPTRGSGERCELPQWGPGQTHFCSYSRQYSDAEPRDSVLFFSRVRIWKGCPLPADKGVWQSVVSSPSGIQGEAPAASAFSAYSRPQNASRRNKKIIFS